MVSTNITAPGGAAAASFLQERLGLSWGPDVFGITEGGVSIDVVGPSEGRAFIRVELIGIVSRGDVERFVELLWTKPESRSSGRAET